MLLSDGDDTSSLIEFDEVLDLAKRSETAIYAIGLRQGEIGRREFKEAEFVLRQLVAGDRRPAFFPTDARELPKIYQADLGRARQPVRDRLLVGEPEARRRVAAHPGPHRGGRAHARTKQGYYGPTGS